MTLKAVVETLDGVDKALHGLYTQGDDKKYYLGVEGMVSSSRLEEFRTNNIDLKKALEKFEGINPDRYREMAETERKLKEKKMIDAGEIDKVVAERVAAMKADNEKVIGDLTKSNESLTARLSSVLIDSAVKSAAVAAGVVSTAVDDVVLRAKTTFQVKDGNVVALNDKGEVVYGKDGTTPLTIGEWVTNLKKTATHLFEGMRGSGAPGGKGPGGVDTSKMTATQKISAGLAAQNG